MTAEAIPPGYESVMDAVERVTTLITQVMEGQKNDEAVIAELITNVDICLDALETLPVLHTHMFLHNVAVACRRLALLGHAEYLPVSLRLASAAVDDVHRDVSQTGRLDHVLMIVTTYLRVAMMTGETYGGVERIHDLLEFASRSDDHRLRDDLFEGWVLLAVVHIIQSSHHASQASIRRLELAQTALVAAARFEPELPLGIGIHGFSFGMFRAAEPLVRACLAPDSTTAESAFNELIQSRATIDAAFAAGTTDPGEWRELTISCAAVSHTDAPEVFCRFAAALIEADGYLNDLRQIVRKRKRIVRDDFTHVLSRARWLNTAWERVVLFLFPLIQRRLSSVIRSNAQLRQTRGSKLARQLMSVLTGVAQETRLPLALVHLTWEFMTCGPDFEAYLQAQRCRERSANL